MLVGKSTSIIIEHFLSIQDCTRVLIIVEIPGITSNYLVIHPHWFTAEIPFSAIFPSGLLTPIFFLPPLELKSLETSKWICHPLHLGAVFLSEVLSQSKIGVLAVHSTYRLPSPKSWGICLTYHPQRHLFHTHPTNFSFQKTEWAFVVSMQLLLFALQESGVWIAAWMWSRSRGSILGGGSSTCHTVLPKKRKEVRR